MNEFSQEATIIIKILIRGMKFMVALFESALKGEKTDLK